jgi:CheY-like chemotaxis protein
MPDHVRPERILVVDDEEEIRLLAGMILDAAGYEVEMVDGGQAALDTLAHRPPDLMILDIKMPIVDGWAVLERVATLPTPPPVIVISGTGMEGNHSPALVHVKGFLLKPFRVDEVVTAVARVLEAQRTAADPLARRRVPRRPLVIGAKLLGQDGRPLALGTLVDISLVGARFDLGVPLKPGTGVRLAVEIPGLGPLQLEGEVRWSKEGVVGVQFPSPASQQGLLREIVDDPPDEPGG